MYWGAERQEREGLLELLGSGTVCLSEEGALSRDFSGVRSPAWAECNGLSWGGAGRVPAAGTRGVHREVHRFWGPQPLGVAGRAHGPDQMVEG